MNSLALLFYPKKKPSNPLVSSIYCRITYNHRRTEFSIGREINTREWDKRASKVKGTSDESKSLNKFLDTIKTKVYEIQDRMIRNCEDISASAIKREYLGKEKKAYYLLEVFEEHNLEIASLIGKGYSSSTVKKYGYTLDHIKAYLKFKKIKGDIAIREVDYNFVSGFETYLKSEKSCGHNTTVKYMVNFKKIIRRALANKWMKDDPFVHWKGSWKFQEREFLSQKELRKIEKKKIKIQRLDQVRDVFVFSCYTGLAFADIKKLNTSDVVEGDGARRWIKTRRKKTNSLSRIPLLSVPEKILEKYKCHPYVESGNGILPVLTNQKFNSYLKEIADICKIRKNLTTHIARHTFATTVTLSKGVPIETVAQMLGHSSLKTTQIYAKVIDEKIERDMNILSSKLDIYN